MAGSRPRGKSSALASSEALGTVDREQAAVILHPIRARLLRELAEPGSAASLARKLELPRQQLNYHLRLLEKAGLLEEVETRTRGNCVERIVRAKARAYVIAPQGPGVDPDSIVDRASANYLLAVAAQTLRDVSRVQQLASAAGQRLATLTLQTEVRFESPAARQAFTRELGEAIEQLIGKYHSERGRPFRLMVGAYPPPPPEPEDPES
ncbi:helix-turn-helix domain-containing protein [Nannocystaceae bacterium ST9]